MQQAIEERRELVARFLRECEGAGHRGPEMVTMALLPEIQAKGEDLGERQLWVTMTATEKDRYGDIVRSSGAKLKNFRKNPIVLFGHRHDLPAVAVVKKIKKEKERVRALVEFAETDLGMELYYLYSNGYMKAWSIGFIPLKWEAIEDDDDSDGSLWGPVDIKSWELLELSAVAVPACPSALTNSIKSGSEEDITKSVREWREGLVKEPKPEDDISEILPPIGKCHHCGGLASVLEGGVTGTLCDGCALQYANDIVEPADDIRPSFDEAVEEFRAKYAETKEVENFEYPEDDTPDMEAELIDLTEEEDVDEEDVENKASDDTYKTIPYKKYPKDDEDAAWDAGEEVGEMEVEDLKKYATLVVKDADDTKGGYKLPHHTSEGKTNLRGCRAAIGVLNGARGGLVPAPSDDVKTAAYNHLARHVREFDEEPAELKGTPTMDVRFTNGITDEDVELLRRYGDEAERSVTILERLAVVKDRLGIEEIPSDPADPEPDIEDDEDDELTDEEKRTMVKEALDKVIPELGKEIGKAVGRALDLEMGRPVD